MNMRLYRGPAPDDFAEVCARLGTREVEQHYGIGHSIRERWQRETGVRLDNKVRGTLMPADFHLHAQTEPRPRLMERYGLTITQVNRLLKMAGLEPVPAATAPRPERLRPMPDDFPQVARTKSRHQLGRHYRACDGVVNRWCVQAGIEPPRAASTGVHRAMAPCTIFNAARDSSLVGRAAEHLRRIHSNVYRADILSEAERKRLPNKGKGLFVVSGKGAMTGAALIDLARAKGFDPNAWQRA